MNKWTKRKWIKALKSGEYGKGKGNLGRGDEYCCLGVFVCEMAPEFGVWKDGRLVVNGSGGYLPDDLATMYGLGYYTQRSLGRLNDDSASFTPVIDWIEANL